MKKLIPLALHALSVAALAAFSSGAGAQTSPPGRVAFDKSGCSSCHAYLSRRSGPSIRSMLTKFQGEPEQALDAIHQIQKHEPLLITGKISGTDLALMSGWLSDTSVEEIQQKEKIRAASGRSHTDISLTHRGRIIFDFKGCRSCHGYASRRGAAMVREMLTTFEGDPEGALERINKTPQHAPGIKSGTLSTDDHKTIAEWIGGAPLAQSAPPAPAPVASLPEKPITTQAMEKAGETMVLKPVDTAVTASPRLTAEVMTAAPVAALVATPVALPRPAPKGTVTGIAIQPGSKSDRLVLSFTGKEPDDLDIRTSNGNLVVALPGFSLAPSVAKSIAAGNTARAVSNVRATEEDGGVLVLTVTPRSGELRHDAIQGRNRISIDLVAILPSKKKTAEAVPIAAAPAAVPVAKPVAPVAAAKTKPDVADAKPDLKAKATAEAKAKREAETQALARKEADERARREAETKAKKEAETQALARKEAEAKAAAKPKKEAEDRARIDAAESAKRELEMLAALKASADALKGSADLASGGRRDRSKMKRPEKFRDDPCPPIAQSEPIGHVDEKRAKDIMDRIGCTQCHAQVQVKTGPPLKRVFEKVKGNPSCVVKMLKENKEHKEEGVTDDLRGPEFKIVADYYATRVK